MNAPRLPFGSTGRGRQGAVLGGEVGGVCRSRWLALMLAHVSFFLSRIISIKTIEVGQGGAQISYAPSKEQVLSDFDGVVSQGISLLCRNHVCFIHHKGLVEFTHNLLTMDNVQSEVIELQKVIYSSESFRRSNHKYGAAVQQAFSYLEAQAGQLAKQLEIYHRHQSIGENYLDQLDAEEINLQLEQFKRDHSVLQAIELQ